MIPARKYCNSLFRYNRYFNRNATAQRIAISAFVRAIRLHPKYDMTPQPLFCCNALRMYVSALHHLGSLYSEMNNAEMAYKVLQKAAAMRPDRKDISCNLFMAQRRYGIWNVRAIAVDFSSTASFHIICLRLTTTWLSVFLTCGNSAC